MEEKSKSTFRSALRGKKKKTVAFSEPTYVNYSDMEYSSDEEDVDEHFDSQVQDGDHAEAGTDTNAGGDADAHAEAQDQLHQQQQKQRQEDQHDGQGGVDEEQHFTDDAMMDESARVEPLKPKAHKEAASPAAATAAAPEPSKEDVDEKDDDGPSDVEQLETKPDGPSRSRNGTVRNTDSFFKDETVETKKITLTPNLLRDDNTTPRPSAESKELKQRPSLDKVEKMEREMQPDKKDDRKKKDKKSGGIRGFFSRKDKKRSVDDDDDSFGKRSMDAENEHDDGRSDLRHGHASPEKSGLQRQPSKLQKQQPRTEPSPTRRPGSASQKSSTRELANYIVSENRNDVSNVPPATMRIVQEQQQQQQREEEEEAVHLPTAGRRGQSQPGEPVRPGSSHKEDRSGLSKMKLSRSAGADKPNKVEKPQKVTRAKSRVELDDFDSSDEEAAAATGAKPSQDHQDGAQRPQLPGAYPDSFASGQNASSNKQASDDVAATMTRASGDGDEAPERLSESPVQVSNDPPGLTGDMSSQEDASSKSPSPELVDTNEAARRAQDSMTSSTSTNNSRGSSWNDAKLRAFFDSDSDIRDMLVVVYDKSDVVPAGPDHPLVGSLFREQNAKLAEITTVRDLYIPDELAK